MWDLFKRFLGIDDRRFGSFPYDNPFSSIQPPIEYSDSDSIENDTIPFGFSVFTNPVEMQTFLEKQMDELLKNALNFGNNGYWNELSEQHCDSDDSCLREEFLKPECSHKRAQDSDLDGRISSSEIERFLETGNNNKPEYFSRSLSIHTIYKPDGTVETIRTEKRSDGNEERTTVTHGNAPPGFSGQQKSSDIDRITKLFF